MSAPTASVPRSESAPVQLSVMELAEILDAEVRGDAGQAVSGLQMLEHACANDLAFVGAEKHFSRVGSSSAQVILVPAEMADRLPADDGRAYLLVDEPEVAFLSVASILSPQRSRRRIGISPQATVAPSARIGANTNVHPGAVIGEDVVIGHNCDILPGVVIGDGCRIGEHVILHPNVVLYPDMLIGSGVIIHANAVIGADGFGYRLVDGGHRRLPHYGIVRICDDVEIGAGTTIDRAKVGETVIGRGTRIDNQVMIGHNCRVGEHNLLVSQVGFAGSVTTGDYVVVAGQAGIADHVDLGHQCVVGAQAGVHRDMPGGRSYLGSPAQPAAETARQLTALRRLPDIRTAQKSLIAQVNELQEQLAALREQLPPQTAVMDDAA